MNIVYSDDLGEYIVINFDYAINTGDLSYIKMNGSKIIAGITFYYRELLTLGEIRARIGKAEPLVAIYVKDTNDFYMFHDVNKVMTHKVN